MNTAVLWALYMCAVHIPKSFSFFPIPPHTHTNNQLYTNHTLKYTGTHINKCKNICVHGLEELPKGNYKFIEKISEY